VSALGFTVRFGSPVESKKISFLGPDLWEVI
jgi:hypothetical protein